MTKSPEFKPPFAKKEIVTPQAQPVVAKPFMAQPDVAKPVVSHFLAQPVMTPPQTMPAKAPEIPILPKVAKAPEAMAPKAAETMVAKPLKAPKIAKVAKVAKVAKALKAPKIPRQAPAVLALKPVIETVTEPVVEIPRLFETQMKKLQQDWFFKDLDTGDIHIANAEIRELVETTRKAAIDAISAMNKEMENFCQHSVDDGFAAVKEMMSAKTLPEAMAAQNKVAMEVFNAALQCGLKFNAIATRTALNAFHPLADSLSHSRRGFF